MFSARRCRIPSITTASTRLGIPTLFSSSNYFVQIPQFASTIRFASAAPAKSNEDPQQSFVTPTVFGTAPAFGKICRTVHPKGFLSPLHDTFFYSPETKKSDEYKTAKKLAVDEGKSILLTGPANTGKRALLVELLSNHFVDEGKPTELASLQKIAIVSMRADRAFAIPNAFYAPGFFGLRHFTSTTPVEQLASAMLRHIRLMKSAYGSCITTLRDIDVLAIDSLEEMHPNLFRALDNVAREMKGKPNLPFGGIQVIATANFWRTGEVDASSPHGIYTFQLDLFRRTFPAAQTLLMHRFVHRDKKLLTPEQIKTLDDYTINALFGNLPEDVKAFESFFSQQSLPYKLPLSAAHALLNSSNPTASSFGGSNNNSSNNNSSSSATTNNSQQNNNKRNNISNNNNAAIGAGNRDLQTCQFSEFAECVSSMFPAFCRHPTKRTRATEYANGSLRKFQSRFTGWLSSILILPFMSGSAFGLPHKCNFKVNDVVTFTRDYHEIPETEDEKERLMGFLQEKSNKKSIVHSSSSSSSPDACGSLSLDTIVVRKGSLGTIVEVGEFKMKVQLWGGDRRVISVLPMKVSSFHSTYPSCVETVMQFPLLSARKVYPDALVLLNLAPEAIVADARFFTEVNEFGNFLALLRTNAVDFKFVREFFERPANVHEATKNYYDSLIEENNTASSSNSSSSRCFGTMPFRSTLSARLCKNCKSHVKEAEFKQHWLDCVHSFRWCPECSTTVPLEKWEAHNEKHTVVMCLDCGRPLEWRNWALHRNTCGAMIREVSSNNEFLPTVTQQTALQMGIDGRDLHTVKQISKGALPKSARQISKTHKTSFMYKASGY